MSLVLGKDVVVAEYNSTIDQWVLYACARTCTLKLSTEVIETTVSGQGKFQTIYPAKMSYSGSIEGLVNLGDNTVLSLPDLRLKQINQDRLKIRFVSTAKDGTTYTEEGFFYITDSENSAPYDNSSSFTIEFKGDGAIAQVFTETEIVSNVKRFEYTGVGGETFFTNVIDKETGNTITLTGKIVLGLEKDGVGFSKMITSGTPTGKQFKFDDTTGRIDVPVAFEAGEEAFGYYRN